MFAAIYFAGFFIGGTTARPFVPLAMRSVWVAIIAVLCVAICLALRAWGSSYLRAATVWSPSARTDTLIVAGPFRFVRNPLYLATIFLSIGAGLMAPPAGFGFIVVANIVFAIALARHEETVLEAAYGSRYREYAANVPSLIPRMTPVQARPGPNPSWFQGLLSEVFVAALLIGIILALLDRRHPALDFFVAYVAGLVAQILIARSRGVQAGPSF